MTEPLNHKLDVSKIKTLTDVKKFAGQQTVSVELIDRSSPAFFAELVRQMEFAYAKATDAYAVTRASATASASTAKAYAMGEKMESKAEKKMEAKKGMNKMAAKKAKKK